MYNYLYAINYYAGEAKPIHTAQVGKIANTSVDTVALSKLIAISYRCWSERHAHVFMYNS